MLFALLLASLVIASLARRRPAGHPPSPIAPAEAGDSLVAGHVTLDARDRRGRAYFDFSRLSPVDGRDPAGWDIAARRHRPIVNGGEGFAGRGGAVELTGAEWEEVVEAPAEGYDASHVTPGGDSVNVALDDWYRYGFFSHLLEPKAAVYVVRTADGRYAKLRFLSYYCPGADPGCLTFEYVYQGDGTRRLDSPSRPARDTQRGPTR